MYNLLLPIFNFIKFTIFVNNYIMIKSKFALIIDAIFISTLVNLLLFVWLRHEIKNANLLRFFLILMFLLLFSMIIFFFFKSNNKKFLRGANEKFLKSCMEFLRVCDYEKYSNFLCRLISCKKITSLFYEFQDNFLYINLKTSMSANDYFIAQELFLNENKPNNKIIFIYTKTEKDFDELSSLSSLNFSCISSEVILKLMTNKNIYPIKKEEPRPIDFKQKIKNAFLTKTQGVTKSHFKKIFFTSISLLVLSLIVPFSKYYLIMGTILLIISIFSLFKKDLQANQDDSDLFQ